MSTTETEAKELARRIPEEIINEGNLELADELFADDYVGRLSGIPEPLHGPEALKGFASELRTAFPDVEMTVEDVIAEDDKVVRRDRMTGTHEGEYRGIEPTGNEVEVEGIVILRVEDGQIVETWGQSDMMGAMQQLGVVEAPGA